MSHVSRGGCPAPPKDHAFSGYQVSQTPMEPGKVVPGHVAQVQVLDWGHDVRHLPGRQAYLSLGGVAERGCRRLEPLDILGAVHGTGNEEAVGQQQDDPDAEDEEALFHKLCLRLEYATSIAEKVSHCSKNERGAEAYAAFFSVIRTVRQRGESVLDTLVCLLRPKQFAHCSP